MILQHLKNNSDMASVVTVIYIHECFSQKMSARALTNLHFSIYYEVPKEGLGQIMYLIHIT